MSTTRARAVQLAKGPMLRLPREQGAILTPISASGGPAPCEAGPGPSPVSGEGSGSGGRARPPAHAELFSSRQAALSPRGDSRCLISGWGGAGRRLTAGIAWHGHRPGRQEGIRRGALDGVHRPSRSSAKLCGQGTSRERGRVRGSDQLQQVACGSVPNCTAAVCFLLASELGRSP